MSLKTEISLSIMKLTPPAAVIWASIAGWGPQQWMYGLTCVYLVLQIAVLVLRSLREMRSPKP